jgi:hypothetical protein
MNPNKRQSISDYIMQSNTSLCDDVFDDEVAKSSSELFVDALCSQIDTDNIDTIIRTQKHS